MIRISNDKRIFAIYLVGSGLIIFSRVYIYDCRQNNVWRLANAVRADIPNLFTFLWRCDFKKNIWADFDSIFRGKVWITVCSFWSFIHLFLLFYIDTRANSHIFCPTRTEDLYSQLFKCAYLASIVYVSTTATDGISDSIMYASHIIKSQHCA